jgi:hypothetical protein
MDARQRRQDHVGGDPAVSASFGAGDVQPGRRSEPHAVMWDAVEERERFAREHPEVLIKPRREAGRLLFEVSAPGFPPGVGYDDALTMLDDLRKRYPAV